MNEYGLEESPVLYGRARVTEGGAPELLHRLARTTLRPDVKFPPMPNTPPGFVIRISVERIDGVVSGPAEAEQVCGPTATAASHNALPNPALSVKSIAARIRPGARLAMNEVSLKRARDTRVGEPLRDASRLGGRARPGGNAAGERGGSPRRPLPWPYA